MTKAEFVSSVADKAGLSKKDAEAAVKAFGDTVLEALKANDKVALPGFGTFAVSERAARTAKNPRTGEVVSVAACKSAKFKAASAVKEALN